MIESMYLQFSINVQSSQFSTITSSCELLVEVLLKSHHTHLQREFVVVGEAVFSPTLPELAALCGTPLLEQRSHFLS